MPRALPAEATGLRGPGQNIFPEDAKETGRRVGLKEAAVQIFREEQVEDAGGDWSTSWKPSEKRIRGRIDPVGGATGRGDMFAEGIREGTTHIVTMDPGVDVDEKDRIEVEGKMWTVTAEEIVSDPASTMVQVKEL